MLAFVLAGGLVSAPAHALAQDGNPNLPSEEELELFAVEGTLDERVAYQESFEQTADPLLLELMSAGDGQASEFDTRGTMPRTGEARLLALRVSYPGDSEHEPMYEVNEVGHWTWVKGTDQEKIDEMVEYVSQHW